jgi:hypothetical protein
MKHMPNLPVLTSQQVVDSYHGPKRRLYQEALYSLEKDGLTEKDAILSMFTKREKQDVGKAPRGINPRDRRYNLRLGKYLKHAEHKYFRAINKVYGAHTKATVIKGFNADESAQLIVDKWNRFLKPVAIGLDASKFDMHVSVAALRYEHSFYEALFPGNSELRWLLKLQLHNKGLARAQDGTVKFSMEGTRCSGDLNTSLGNCIIMCALIWAYAKEKKIDLELANNGDDCVVFMERRDEESFRHGLSEWFVTKGFAMTVEPTVDELERVEFCQSKPVQLSTGWRMVRNVGACLNKDPMCLIDIPNDKVYKKWLGAVGMCGSKLTSGVPVLSEFYDVFSRAGEECSEGMLREIFKNTSRIQLAQGLSTGEINDHARVSFYYAFGILPDEQKAIERFYHHASVGPLNNNTIEREWLVVSPGANIVTEESN